VVGEAVERVCGDAADELGVLTAGIDATANEVVFRGEDLRDDDPVGETSLREVPEQFRSVVHRVGPTPLQFDQNSGITDTRHVDLRPCDAVFEAPVECGSRRCEAVAQSLLDLLGEFAHELAHGGPTGEPFAERVGERSARALFRHSETECVRSVEDV
jgi:hypothetical protein